MSDDYKYRAGELAPGIFDTRAGKEELDKIIGIRSTTLKIGQVRYVLTDDGGLGAAFVILKFDPYSQKAWIQMQIGNPQPVTYEWLVDRTTEDHRGDWCLLSDF